ncbi:MAG: T9SS type A sorting domain-containing protein, partial [Bacteroidetes bacterium]|nr:T9SS type A sorting domain-containing protein [Bacteroidota bacterium]
GSAVAVVAGVGAVTASGLTQFCPYVLSSVAVPLPIELVDFSAGCSPDDKVILNWSTASEKNGAYFAVMNSNDGYHFTKIATINATGNSSSLHKYSYTVDHRSEYGNYYSLKMVDIDLSSSNSKTEFVGTDCNKEQAPDLFYNQQSGIVVTATTKEVRAYILNIFDAAGRLIRKNDFTMGSGYNNHAVEPQVANGVYLVTLSYGDDKKISKKIVIVN